MKKSTIYLYLAIFNNNNNNHNSNKEGKEKTMIQNIGEKGIRVIGKMNKHHYILMDIVNDIFHHI